MSVLLGQIFPDFEADTTEGHIKFHDWLGDSWGILFSHPSDFTPVCTTELGRAAKLAGEFEKRHCKMIGLSCEGVDSHKGWIDDIKAYNNLEGEFPYPIIADEDRTLGVKFGMIDPDEIGKSGMPLTCRSVFIIGPDKKLKLSMLYPATTGRNFNEILRALDSLQLTAKQRCATPVDWQPGQACMVLPGVTMDEAKTLFPDMKVHQVPSGKMYLRTSK